jgi:hypothetical protein
MSDQEKKAEQEQPLTIERFVVDGVEMPLLSATPQKWESEVDDVLLFMETLDEMDAPEFVVSTATAALSD